MSILGSILRREELGMVLYGILVYAAGGIGNRRINSVSMGILCTVASNESEVSSASSMLRLVSTSVSSDFLNVHGERD